MNWSVIVEPICNSWRYLRQDVEADVMVVPSARWIRGLMDQKDPSIQKNKISGTIESPEDALGLHSAPQLSSLLKTTPQPPTKNTIESKSPSKTHVFRSKHLHTYIQNSVQEGTTCPHVRYDTRQKKPDSWNKKSELRNSPPRNADLAMCDRNGNCSKDTGK